MNNALATTDAGVLVPLTHPARLEGDATPTTVASGTTSKGEAWTVTIYNGTYLVIVVGDQDDDVELPDEATALTEFQNAVSGLLAS